MKVKAWLDSTANIHSKRVIELDFDDEVWASMTDEDKDSCVQEALFQYLDWGWEEA